MEEDKSFTKVGTKKKHFPNIKYYYLLLYNNFSGWEGGIRFRIKILENPDYSDQGSKTIEPDTPCKKNWSIFHRTNAAAPLAIFALCQGWKNIRT